MSGPSLVEFEPVGAGPFEVSRLPVSGAIAAAGFLLGLALAARLTRRAGLRASLMLELFAVGAPAVLLASRLPALIRSFPAFLHEPHVAARAFVAPGSLLLGAVAALGLALSFAWASRQPVAFLDSLAPGAALVVAGILVARSLALESGLAASALVLLALAGMAAQPPRGRPGLVAVILGSAALGLLLVSSRA